METNLLDRMLNEYQAAQVQVTVTLQNKIRVTGRISAFDSYVIVVDGQKREILYRHAVSSLAPHVQEERRPAPPPQKPQQQRPAVRHQGPVRAPRPSHQVPLAAAPAEGSINTSMKDGLLKWMQEQKASK
ncbi:MAG TPA: RNA chaperone Hfq [Nitrospirota bacterium]|nr:RNA chaperone Hfq [Nitrospirota bacterium]